MKIVDIRLKEPEERVTEPTYGARPLNWVIQ